MTYDPLIWLKVTSLSSTASKSKDVKNQENSEFLMIQPTLSDQNKSEEVIKATEVVEAVEVIEATKVSHARKSLSL